MEGIKAKRSLGTWQPSKNKESNQSTNESLLRFEVAPSNQRPQNRTNSTRRIVRQDSETTSSGQIWKGYVQVFEIK